MRREIRNLTWYQRGLKHLIADLNLQILDRDANIYIAQKKLWKKKRKKDEEEDEKAVLVSPRSMNQW